MAIRQKKCVKDMDAKKSLKTMIVGALWKGLAKSRAGGYFGLDLSITWPNLNIFQ